MVKNSMDSSLGVSLTVSAVCCPVEAGEDPAGIARYVQAVLEPVFHPAGIAVEVAPLAYQPCGKVPVIITLDGQDPRLLWYYKGMPAEALFSLWPLACRAVASSTSCSRVYCRAMPILRRIQSNPGRFAPRG